MDVASRFGAAGHVVDTVPLALYCAQSIASEPLPAVIAQTIGAGGDTDTIAAITGQIAGAVVGLAETRKLVANIEGIHEVVTIAEHSPISFTMAIARWVGNEEAQR